jgi:hypothetical protein
MSLSSAVLSICRFPSSLVTGRTPRVISLRTASCDRPRYSAAAGMSIRRVAGDALVPIYARGARRTAADRLLYPQQIIWNKGRTVLTRTHYWYQHEPCWYLRKKNAPWFGKAGQNSTIWDSPSPKFIMGGSDEEKWDHPTQKPVELMRRRS